MFFSRGKTFTGKLLKLLVTSQLKPCYSFSAKSKAMELRNLEWFGIRIEKCSRWMASTLTVSDLGQKEDNNGGKFFALGLQKLCRQLATNTEFTETLCSRWKLKILWKLIFPDNLSQISQPVQIFCYQPSEEAMQKLFFDFPLYRFFPKQSHCGNV